MGPIQKTMLPTPILEGPVQQTSKGPIKDCYLKLLQQSFNKVPTKFQRLLIIKAPSIRKIKESAHT